MITVIAIKATIDLIKKMEKANTCGLMEKLMRVTIRLIRNMVKVSIPIKMEVLTRAIGKMIKNTGLACKNGPRDRCTSGTGLMVNIMDKE